MSDWHEWAVKYYCLHCGTEVDTGTIIVDDIPQHCEGIDETQ